MAARRQELLQAMGVTLYRRRGAASAPAFSVATAMPVVVSDGLPALVIVGRSEDRASVDLLLRALALDVARMHWIDATPERLSTVPPEARAFIAMGEALARPLGAELSTDLQQRAQIVVTAAPAQWRGASGKRALWQVLKPLRRHLLG